MKALITGSAGLVGSACVRLLCEQDWEVVGIDNNQREKFFGPDGSTKGHESTHKNYTHIDADVRHRVQMRFIMESVKPDFIIHTAGQPAHDLAARIPYDDFDVNAVGTLNMLVAARDFCPNSPFVYTSTSKVYGDNPNTLIQYKEQETRYEPVRTDFIGKYAHGIAENFPIDHALHSLFGASKLAADILVQEYGRYFSMPTMLVRPGCVTGVGHASVPLHGFLSYLVKCAVRGLPYTVIGYKGKQVRDNIAGSDLATAFLEWYKSPKTPGAVYNLGGGRESNCSIIEAIDDIVAITGGSFAWTYEEKSRIGDHIWFIGDDTKWKADFPNWKREFNHKKLVETMVAAEVESVERSHSMSK